MDPALPRLRPPLRENQRRPSATCVDDGFGPGHEPAASRRGRAATELLGDLLGHDPRRQLREPVPEAGPGAGPRRGCQPNGVGPPRGEAGRGLLLGHLLRQRSDRGSARTLDAFLKLCGRADAGHCAFSAGTPAATKAKFDALLRRLRTHPQSADITYAELVAKTGSPGLYLTPYWSPTASCLQEVWTTGHTCSLWAPAATPTAAATPLLPPADASAAPTGQPYPGQEQLLAIVCAESPNPPPPRSGRWTASRTSAPAPLARGGHGISSRAPAGPPKPPIATPGHGIDERTTRCS